MRLGPIPRHRPTRRRFPAGRRTGLLAALASTVVVLLAAPGRGQEYPPSSETLAVSTSVAVPGEPVTISGSGYEPGTTVTVTFESTPRVVGVLQADASGRFTTQVVIPVDATPGMHTIKATGMGADGNPRVVSAAIRVMVPAAGAVPADVPGGGAVADVPPARGAVAGATAPSASRQTPAAGAPPARRSSRLGLTGPVAIPLLVFAGLACVAVGTLLTRVRRRRPVT